MTTKWQELKDVLTEAGLHDLTKIDQDLLTSLNSLLRGISKRTSIEFWRRYHDNTNKEVTS